MTPLAYSPPRIANYGSILQMSVESGLLLPGMTNIAQLSAQTLPGGGEGGTLPGSESGTAPDSDTGSGDQGGVGGENASGSDGGSNGGGSGGTGGGGGGETGGGNLPFSGFPAAVAAGVGGALTGVGAALRRRLRRRS